MQSSVHTAGINSDQLAGSVILTTMLLLVRFQLFLFSVSDIGSISLHFLRRGNQLEKFFDISLACSCYNTGYKYFGYNYFIGFIICFRH